jgi:CRP-like cAMP-binding protein
LNQKAAGHFHRKVAAFIAPREAEAAFINAHLLGVQRALLRGETLLHEGTPANNAYVLLNGWAIRFNALSDGRRQILSVLLPGDLIGLDAHLLSQSTASVSAITSCTVAEFRATALVEMLQRQPRLAATLLWMTTREEAFLGERLLSVGRQTAFERVGHFLVEIYHRLKLVGLVDGNSFEYPLTLDFLADAVGMSVVHASRTMQLLQSAKLLRRKNRRIEMLDLERLERETEFAGLYIGRRLAAGEHFLSPKFDER